MVNKDGKTVAPTMEASRPPPPMPTGQRARLLPDPDRPAGRQVLADHRRDLHPDAQAAADAAAAGEALKFFDWAFKNGAKEAEELDYVPMPATSSA